MRYAPSQYSLTILDTPIRIEREPGGDWLVYQERLDPRRYHGVTRRCIGKIRKTTTSYSGIQSRNGRPVGSTTTWRAWRPTGTSTIGTFGGPSTTEYRRLGDYRRRRDALVAIVEDSRR
jgi:hypothetical protein